MASHVSGIAITIRAFLPTGKTVDEQFNALSLVKTAHETGDYSEVLKAAKIDDVKAEQKTRRMEDQPAVAGQTEIPAGTTAADLGANPEPEPVDVTGEPGHPDDAQDDETQATGKKSRRNAA